MIGKTLKQVIGRIPDDAVIVHLWDGGVSWRQSSGSTQVFSFHPEPIGGGNDV